LRKLHESVLLAIHVRVCGDLGCDCCVH
jgi:hypothetical protein